MSDETMESLREQWSSATTERERAQLEARMFALDGVGHAIKRGLIGWAHMSLGVSTFEARGRMSLQRAQPATELLWERVDGDERMAVNTAANILQRAKKLAKAAMIPLSSAIAEELKDYESWAVCTLPNGRTFRRQPQRTKRVSGASTARVKTSHGVKDTRARMAVLRAAVRNLIETDLAGLDKATRDALRSQAEAELAALLDTLNARIRRAINTNVSSAYVDGVEDAVADVETQKQRLRDACEALGVDPPEHSSVTHTEYMAAKANYRKLVKAYHPDVNREDGATERYRHIVDSMQIIEQSYQSNGA